MVREQIDIDLHVIPAAPAAEADGNFLLTLK